MEKSPLESLKAAIGRNCDIADADGASIFSICGMALRLRDLNKWEKGLLPWEENQPAVLLDWIDEKEQTWEALAGKTFDKLPIEGDLLDPFDTKRINDILAPHGLFYGAGYAHSLKPTFFLARIREHSQIKDIPIVILEKELMRDLLTIPALNQDDATHISNIL